MVDEEKEAKVFEFSIKNDIAQAEELCTNIAKYAYGTRSESVDVFLKLYEDQSLLRIRDDGDMFDPTQFVDDSGNEITGLSLIRALPTEVTYNRMLGFNTTIITVSNNIEEQ